MSDSPSPPASPDYVGAAYAQGAANKDTALATAQLSNPNVNTPYGGQKVTYNWDYNTGSFQPTVDQFLSPAQQALQDKYTSINSGLGDVATQGLGYVQSALNKPFDTGALPAQQINPGQTAQDAIMSRLEPQLKREGEQLNTQLTNQGLAAGGEAYNNAQTIQSQRANDLKLQAALQGIGVGQQARQQGLQEQSFLRNEPVNMLNAVRSSSQINTPTFQQYSGATVAPTPLASGVAQQGQAANNLYSAQVGAQNSQNSGLYSLGTAAIAAAAYY
jgi:hypothetical protein